MRQQMSTKRLCGLLAMLTLVALGMSNTLILAGSLEDGKAAYDRSDYVTALRLLRPLAEKTQADLNALRALEASSAQFTLGVMYEEGKGVQRDYNEAVKWYRQAVERQYAPAQSALGSMYADGLGVARDDKEAARLYRLAAEQGFSPAQFNLGLMYDNGHGVQKDSAEAVKWYRRAAEQGYDEAQSYLAISYFDGDGVEQSYTEAVKWTRKAAEQGLAKAQSNLGFMYSEGLGLPQNQVQAVQWYSRAAEQGFTTAQRTLAIKYEEGKGVKQDFVQAYKWFSIAATGSRGTKQELEDRNDAAKRRDFIASKMTSKQIVEPQQLARDWKPAKPGEARSSWAASRIETKNVAAPQNKPPSGWTERIGEWRIEYQPEQSEDHCYLARQYANGYAIRFTWHSGADRQPWRTFVVAPSPGERSQYPLRLDFHPSMHHYTLTMHDIWDPDGSTGLVLYLNRDNDAFVGEFVRSASVELQLNGKRIGNFPLDWTNEAMLRFRTCQRQEAIKQ